MTPVAIVEPVELVGAIVQRVALHNASNVERLGIGVGDEVLVSRRNDVIPCLEEVVVKHGDRAAAPSECVTCKAALLRRGEYLVCNNLDCRSIIEGRIQRWVGTQDILEWGDKRVAQLVEAKLVREPADLYGLKVDDIAKLERRGAVIAEKVLDNLRARLPLTLPVFLASLGIDDFALETAKLIVSAGYNTLEKVQAATADELERLKGMGASKARSVVSGLAQRAEEIQRLLAVGVVPVAPMAGGGLSGKSFCFTGSLPLPRKEYEDLVEKHGGTLLSGVTKELGYLVMADPSSASSKAEKARKYGTQCIDASAFMALVEAAAASAPAAPVPPADAPITLASAVLAAAQPPGPQPDPPRSRPHPNPPWPRLQRRPPRRRRLRALKTQPPAEPRSSRQVLHASPGIRGNGLAVSHRDTFGRLLLVVRGYSHGEGQEAAVSLNRDPDFPRHHGNLGSENGHRREASACWGKP